MKFRDKELDSRRNKTLCRNPLVKIGCASLHEIQDFSISQIFIVRIASQRNV